MKRALELAAQGTGYTSPNPMVGAVIIDEQGNVVGEGYHKKVGTPHAEIHAIQEAGERTENGVIYVNLEPCSHYGRTPPCCKAIVEAGLKTAVIGMVDPNPAVAGRGIKYLTDHGVTVYSPVMEREAKELNRAFSKYITTKKPYVTMKTALTLDGKIATHTGDSKWITGEPSRQKVHQLRHEVDAIMVGINTVLTDNPMLTTRLPHGRGKDPIRLIVDSSLRTPLDSNVIVNESTAKTIIFTGNHVEEEKRNLFNHIPKVQLVAVPTNSVGVDLNWVMNWLGQQGIIHVLLEGGANLNFSAMFNHVVDEYWFFYAPKLIGGQNAPTAIGGQGIERMAEACEIFDMKVETIGEDILVRGYAKGVS